MTEELEPIIFRYTKSKKCDTGTHDFGCRIPIWICWWQGQEAMPSSVKICFERVCSAFSDDRYEVVLLHKNNYRQYIELPQYVTSKIEAGKIELAHVADILRWGCVANYGGVWMDSTLYIMDVDHFKDKIYGISKYPFFTQRFDTEEECPNEPCQGKWCNGFFAGSIDRNRSVIFQFVYDSLLYYWEKHDLAFHYVFLDYILICGYNMIDEIRKDINAVPANNKKFFNGLIDVINAEYSDELWMKLTLQGDFYRFPYKLNFNEINNEGNTTVGGYLFQFN